MEKTTLSRPLQKNIYRRLGIFMPTSPHHGCLAKFVRLSGVALIMLAYGSILTADSMAAINPGATKAYVVLIHGLGRSHRSMRFLEHALKNQGYEVINLSYQSTSYPIEDLARAIGNVVEQLTPKTDQQVHFVTHSLGGIILRVYLSGDPPIHIGRIVMLSPPNQGSELADLLRDTPLLSFLGVPAIEQLGTCRACIPSHLGSVHGQVGVITGDKSFNPLSSYLIPGTDDGTVSVKSARVEGMKAFLVLHHSHTFIMQSPEVISQVIHFLEYGIFKGQP
jgi:hypothetical protein